MLDKRLACTAVALVLVVMASVVAASLPGKENTAQMQENVGDVEKEAPRPAEDYVYVLKEHQGRIGVFLAGETEPEMILDVPVKHLPEYDREQMRQGIPARSYSELVALIEDYSS